MHPKETIIRKRVELPLLLITFQILLKKEDQLEMLWDLMTRQLTLLANSRPINASLITWMNQFH